VGEKFYYFSGDRQTVVHNLAAGVGKNILVRIWRKTIEIKSDVFEVLGKGRMNFGTSSPVNEISFQGDISAPYNDSDENEIACLCPKRGTDFSRKPESFFNCESDKKKSHGQNSSYAQGMRQSFISKNSRKKHGEKPGKKKRIGYEFFAPFFLPDAKVEKIKKSSRDPTYSDQKEYPGKEFEFRIARQIVAPVLVSVEIEHSQSQSGAFSKRLPEMALIDF